MINTLHHPMIEDIFLIVFLCQFQLPIHLFMQACFSSNALLHLGQLRQFLIPVSIFYLHMPAVSLGQKLSNSSFFPPNFFKHFCFVLFSICKNKAMNYHLAFYPSNLCFITFESVFSLKSKTQTNDLRFKKKILSLCNLCNLWICVLLPPISNDTLVLTSFLKV